MLQGALIQELRARLWRRLFLAPHLVAIHSDRRRDPHAQRRCILLIRTLLPRHGHFNDVTALIDQSAGREAGTRVLLMPLQSLDLPLPQMQLELLFGDDQRLLHLPELPLHTFAQVHAAGYVNQLLDLLCLRVGGIIPGHLFEIVVARHGLALHHVVEEGLVRLQLIDRRGEVLARSECVEGSWGDRVRLCRVQAIP